MTWSRPLRRYATGPGTTGESTDGPLHIAHAHLKPNDIPNVNDEVLVRLTGSGPARRAADLPQNLVPLATDPRGARA
jgi:hypothetical protein